MGVFNGFLIGNCGEVPLSSYDSCRLGSINLSSMVTNPYTDKARIDYNLLGKVTRVSQRLMDDIVSLEEEKINSIILKIENDPEDPEIKRTELNLWKKVLHVLQNGRRTGVGVLGLGDMLAKLGVTYGTPESIKIADKVFQTIAVNSYKESVQLAKERGCFPIWNADKESHNPFIIRVISNNFTTEEYNDYLTYGRRNIANLSIAPTGCISEETSIKTDLGNMTIKNIFSLNNINIEDYRSSSKIWFDSKKEINVYDKNGEKHKISKLFWNGRVNGYKFKFNDNYEFKTSKEHKLLVYIGNDKAIWKEAKDIVITDKIVKLSKSS